MRLWGSIKGWEGVSFVGCRERLPPKMKSGENDEFKRDCNGNCDGNCNVPAELKQEHDQADEKEDQAENEKDWKGSEYVRDI